MNRYAHRPIGGIILASAVFVLATTTPQRASAQAAAQEAESGTLEEIVVTARKREESILSVPTSISAIDAGTLEAKGVKNLEELARSIPGLSVTPAGENEPKLFILRGIGPAFGTASTVAVYVNDAPITIGTNSPDLQIFDVDRIEVLRGPQGTLFGSSSMGGAIRYVTPKPSFEETTGRVRLETSTTAKGGQGYEGQGAFGGRISDNLAFRASGFYRRDGGYIDVIDEDTGEVSNKDANAASIKGGQLSLTKRYGETVEATASVLYQDSHQGDLNFFHTLRGMTDPPVALGELQKTERVDMFLDDRFLLPSLTVNAQLGGATLTSATSWQRQKVHLLNDLSYFIQGLFGLPGSDLEVPSDRTRHFDAFIQELRLASNSDGNLGWLVGAYYRQTKSTTDQIIPSNIGPVLGLPDDLFLPGTAGAIETLEEEFKGKEVAGFGELSYKITPALALTAGVRYSRLTREVYQIETFAPLLGGGAAIVDLPKSKEDPLTPKFSATYSFSEDHMIYAAAAKGFREGGPNPPLLLVQSCLDSLEQFGLSSPPETFDSDNLWSYELGAKFLTANRRLRFQGDVYQINWKDIQQSIPVGQTCGSSPVANVGEARARGVEAEISWRPVGGLTLDFSGAYTKAEITKDLPALNVTSGTPLSGVPKWTANVATQYDFNIGNGWGGFARAEMQHVSNANRYLDTGGAQPALRRGSYDVVSVRAGVTTGKVDFDVFANNLFDDHVIIGEAFGSFSPGINGQGAARTTIRPRTIGVSATMRF